MRAAILFKHKIFVTIILDRVAIGIDGEPATSTTGNAVNCHLLFDARRPVFPYVFWIARPVTNGQGE